MKSFFSASSWNGSGLVRLGRDNGALCASRRTAASLGSCACGTWLSEKEREGVALGGIDGPREGPTEDASDGWAVAGGKE